MNLKAPHSNTKRAASIRLKTALVPAVSALSLSMLAPLFHTATMAAPLNTSPSEVQSAEEANRPTFVNSEVDRLTVQGLGKFSQADFKGAVVEFTKAIELNPKNGTIFLQRGLASLEMEDFNDALSDFDKALQLEHGNKIALHVCRGRAFMGLTKYKEAMDEFNKAIEVDSKASLAFIGRAETYLLLGEDEKSLADLETALRLDPEQPHAYFLRAMYYKKKKQKELALKDLHTAIELDKDYLVRDAELKKEHDKRDTNGELSGMLHFSGKRGNRASSMIGRGLALTRAGHHLEAIKQLTDAILTSPDSFEAYKWRASLYLDMSSFEQACHDLNKAIEMVPKDPTLYCSRARARLEMGEAQQALEDYTKAIDLSSNKAAGLYVARGLVYSRLGDSAHAIEDFSKAIEIDGNAHAYLNRGLEYIVAKDYGKAIDDLTKSIELNEEKAVAYKFRGQAQHHLGKRAEAITDLEKSAELYNAQKDLFGSRQVARIIAQFKKEN